MFEAIRANKIKSGVLVFLVAGLLIVLGYVVGYAVSGVAEGAWFGVVLAAGVWAILAAISYWSGDAVLMKMSNASEVSPEDYPQLHNVVEELSIAAGLPKPRVFVIRDGSPNAFAAGRSPEHACVAITSGLLEKLNRDELQGVLAHEMSHVLNRDVLYMTLLGVMIGAIVLMCDFFLRYLWIGGGRRGRRSRRGGGGGQAQAIFLVVGLAMAILAPLVARLLYLATSRRREFLADANGAVLTRYPEGLARALEKIAGDEDPLEIANRATAPMYIVNPLKKRGRSLSGLFSTHPPLQERVAILRAMGTGMSLGDYQRAWQAVTQRKGRLFRG
jgi:heat shock protein HtpX